MDPDDLLEMFRAPFAEMQEQAREVVGQLGTLGETIQRTARMMLDFQRTIRPGPGSPTVASGPGGTGPGSHASRQIDTLNVALRNNAMAMRQLVEQNTRMSRSGASPIAAGVVGGAVARSVASEYGPTGVRRSPPGTTHAQRLEQQRAERRAQRERELAHLSPEDRAARMEKYDRHSKRSVRGGATRRVNAEARRNATPASAGVSSFPVPLPVVITGQPIQVTIVGGLPGTSPGSPSTVPHNPAPGFGPTPQQMQDAQDLMDEIFNEHDTAQSTGAGGRSLSTDPTNVRRRQKRADDKRREWARTEWEDLGDPPVPPTPVPPVPPTPVPPVPPTPPSPPSPGGGGGDPWSLERTQVRILGYVQSIALNMTRVPPPGGGGRNNDRHNRMDTTQFWDKGGIGGIAGILAATGFASPSDISTFTGNLKILTGVIGEMFVPYVRAASDVFWSWSNAIKSMSPEWKSWTGKVVVGTVAVLALGAALNRIYLAGRSATVAMVTLGNAMRITSPLMAGLTGLGIVIGGLTAAWWALSGAAKSAGDAMQEANVNIGPDGRPKPKPEISRVDLGFLPHGVAEKIKAPGATATQQAEVLAEFVKNQEEYVERLRQQQLKELGAREQIYKETKQIVDKDFDLLEIFANVSNTQQKLVTQPSGLPGVPGRPHGAAMEEFVKKRQATVSEIENRINEKLKAANLPPITIKTVGGLGGGSGPFQIRRPTIDDFTENTNKQSADLITRTLGIIEKAKVLIEKAGLGDLIAGNKPEDFKPPRPARYTDAAALRESVQLQALNVVDTEAQLVANQMEQWARTHGNQTQSMVDAVKEQTAAIIAAIKAMGMLD